MPLSARYCGTSGGRFHRRIKTDAIGPIEAQGQKVVADIMLDDKGAGNKIARKK
jgi:hypothetical protein